MNEVSFGTGIDKILEKPFGFRYKVRLCPIS